MNISINKYYGDVELRDIFIKKGNQNICVRDFLSANITNSKSKIYYVAESDINVDILQMLSKSSARKYIITSNIVEDKFSILADMLVAREVPNIKGNYIIIDDETLILFDDKLNGVVVHEKETVEKVVSLFNTEFWNNATQEFIQKKQTAGSPTFDIAPIYSESKFYIDNPFDNRMEDLNKNADIYFYTKKIDEKNENKQLVIKSIIENKNFILSTNNIAILYAPNLPMSGCMVNGKYYVANFDLAKYETLPEKKQNRLFSINLDSYSIGAVYKFYKKALVSDLLGHEIIDCNEENVQIVENGSFNRKVDIDLGKMNLILNASEDDQEILLKGIDKEVFDFDGNYINLKFNIDLALKKHSFNRKSTIYAEYDNIKQKMESVKNKLSKFCGETNNEDLLRKLYETAIDFATVEQCQKVKAEFDEIITLANSFDYGDIDSDLNDVSNNSKQRKVFPKFECKSVSTDLPKYGMLFEENDRYEYVLNEESSLMQAIKEMAGKKVEYFLE